MNLTPTLLSLKSGGPNSVTLAHGRHIEKFLGYQDTLPATCIKKASHVASGNAFRISGHETSNLLSRRTTQKKRGRPGQVYRVRFHTCFVAFSGVEGVQFPPAFESPLKNAPATSLEELFGPSESGRLEQRQSYLCWSHT